MPQILRTQSMLDVGYFLSKYGERQSKGTPLPPVELDTQSWKLTYTIFFANLGGGRTLAQFSNSLKNTRDEFDSHMESGRVGWRDQDIERSPSPLSKLAGSTMAQFDTLDRDSVWKHVSQFADLNVIRVSSVIIEDLLSEQDRSGSKVTRTEGGRKVVVSTRIERNPRLREEAVQIHGYSCVVCGFDFTLIYGDWGKEYIEVHHLRPLGESENSQVETNPVTDLAVLCANCHRMTHRRRDKVLTLDELSSKINRRALVQWANQHS